MFWKRSRVEVESTEPPPITHPPAHVTLMEMPDGTTGKTVALPEKPLESLDKDREEPEGYFVHLGDAQSKLPVPQPWPTTSDAVFVQDAHAEHLRFVTFGSMPARGTLVTDHTEVVRLVVLSGSPGVGKTAFIRQLVGEDYHADHYPTRELLWREVQLMIVNDRIPVLLRIADSPSTPTLTSESELLSMNDGFIVVFSHDVESSLDSADHVVRVVDRCSQERSRDARDRLQMALEAIEDAEDEAKEKKTGKKDKKKKVDPYAELRVLTSDSSFGYPPISLVASKIDVGNGPGPLIKTAEKVVKDIGCAVYSVNSQDSSSVVQCVKSIVENVVWQRWRVKRAFNKATE